MALAFIDASSAILLHKAGLFETLCASFSLLMPDAVFEEICRPGYSGADAFEKARAGRAFRVKTPDPAEDHSLYPDLGRLDEGERETIELYLQFACAREPGFVILDDFKGARFCRDAQIPYINALLVPKVLWYAGAMEKDEYGRATKRLLNLGRYSKKIVETALKMTKSDMPKETFHGK